MDEFNTAYYLLNFWGYGNWDSDFWFIGLEEGGGSDLGLINAKINGFHAAAYSHEALSDNYQFQVVNVGYPGQLIALNYIAPGPAWNHVNLQADWKRKIKVLLGINGMPLENEHIREFQALKWGRNIIKNSQPKHAVLEFLPLPSPSSHHWNYAAWTEHFTGIHCPQLYTRATYIAQVFSDRINILQKKIVKYRPKLVLFCSRDNCINRVFEALTHNVPIQVRNIGMHNCRIANHNGTLFIQTPHPNAFGLTNAYWAGLIQVIMEP